MKLTLKQKAFVKELIDNPKRSATEAAARTYQVKNRNVANNIAAENLAKPSIRAELAKHNELFESTIVNTVDDWKGEENTRKREIATNLAMWGHDKIHGKATQKTENLTTSVNLNLSLKDVTD